MDNNLGIKRITVSRSKYIKANGEVKEAKSSGVMNFPEEEVGAKFAIKEENGDISLIRNGEGKQQTVRQSGKQRVLSIGTFVSETSEYMCFKVNDNYLLKAVEGNRRGKGSNIVKVGEVNNGSRHIFYMVLAKGLIEKVNKKKMPVIKVTEYYAPDLKIEISFVKEKSDNKNAKTSYTRYLVNDGKTKTITLKKKMIESCSLKSGDELEGVIEGSKLVFTKIGE